jgi:type II secretory ATPase GspE/PulE/Tfp pilus assembly ATPase PilB-like protein
MGVPNYLTASSLLGIVAQRLVRRTCDDCAQPYELPESLRQAFTLHFGSLEGATFRKGAGCARCNRTGMRGRVGVFELLTITEGERRLIAEGAPVDELRTSAAARGFRTLERDAFEKAKAGQIAPEEIMELGLGFSVDAPMADAAPAST